MAFDRNSKRWDRKRYPGNWEELARACKERANWKCEHCNIKQGEELISKAGNTYKVALCACHMRENDESNTNPDLICLCVRCHGKLDTAYKAACRWGKLETLKHRHALSVRLTGMSNIDESVSHQATA